MPHLQLTRRGFTFVELVIVISIIAALAGIGFPIFMSVRKQVDINATKALISAVVTAMSNYQMKTWTWNAAGSGKPPELRTYHMWDLNHFDSSGRKNPDVVSHETKTLNFYSIDGYTPGSRVDHQKDWQNNVRDGVIFGPITRINKPEIEDPIPDTYDANFPKEVIASGYTGFINMAAPTVHKSFINKRGILVDAWKQPLRIEFAGKEDPNSTARNFGTDPMGIWSPGYDKFDGTFTDTNKFDINKDADDIRSWE